MITFDTNNLQMDIVGSVFPIENGDDETSSEWALSHLDCEEYKKTYDAYSKILICQDNFNTNIKKFLDDIRKKLKQEVVDSDDDNRINELLRFCLAKLVDVSQPNTDTSYQLKHLSNEFNSFNGALHNPFPENLPQLITFMESNWVNIINSINGLKKNIDKLNILITDFQKSLNFVIDNSVTGLKGNCPIDNRLKYWFLLKSYFRQHLHSVSK